jgi:methyl-accepting chemotaxis protein
MEVPIMFNEEITKAIVAHSTWKSRLSEAITTGKSDATAVDAAADNKCAFGMWLHGPEFPAVEKASPAYGDVVKLHAAFHKEAANVLRMALSGERQHATAAMAIGSAYSHASASLLEALPLGGPRAAA